jgi:nucleoside-triphosphatase
MKTNKNILITGKPGCGKSTLVQKLRDEFRDRIISGIITPEIRKGSQRYGFKIMDLSSKKEEIMASVDIQSKKRVSKYYVDVQAVNRILNKFLEGYEKADIFIVDEIGKMELYSEKFKEIIIKILDSNKPVIATIALSRDPFLDKIKRREDSRVFHLEKDNWERVLNEIKTFFQSA